MMAVGLLPLGAGAYAEVDWQMPRSSDDEEALTVAIIRLAGQYVSPRP